MKKFFSILILALTLTFLLSAALMITPSAAADENVVFITDDGTGDGSSPDKALGNADGYETNYQKSSLYLAATKLKNSGGGTIVICGPTTLTAYQSNTDVALPGVPNTLKITSIYNGIDYQTENSAQLNLSATASNKTHIIASSPTLWENLTICTYTSEQVIAGNGYKTTFGEGITTKLADGVTGNNYLCLAGGHRYQNFNRDSDLTVKSGTYYNITGSTYGISSGTYVQNGNVNLKLLGSTAIKNYVNGTGKSSTQVNGNVDIEIAIETGSIMNFYATGAAAFGQAGCEVYVKVGGQRLIAVNTRAFDTVNGNLKAGCFMADKYTLDLTETAFSNLNYIDETIQRNESQINSGKTGFDILYPVSWLNADSITVKNDPVNGIYESSSFDPAGLSIEASFTNKNDNKTVYTTTINYNKKNTAFKFDFDGINTLTYKYGNTVYHTRTDIAAAPTVTLEGAKIRTSMTSYVQGMKFIGRITKAANENLIITDYGILVTPHSNLTRDTDLEYGKIYGMTEFKNSDQSTELIFDDDSITRFGGILNEIRADNYAKSYTARAFVKFNFNGSEYTYYSSPIRRSIMEIANQASYNPAESSKTKSFMTTEVMDTCYNYTTDKVYDKANSDALRAKAIEYMRKQASIQWTPSDNIWIFKSSGVSTIFRAGTTYYGIPYTNNVKADAEYFEYLLDSDGTFQLNNTKANYNFPSHTITWLDEGKTGNTTNQEHAAINYITFPGNDCSSAIINAWNSVLTNRSPGLDRIAWTSDMMPGKFQNDIVPVGDYEYPTVSSNTKYIYTKSMNPNDETIFGMNSKDTIYDAYAQLKPGDAIVYYNKISTTGEAGTGHSRMVVSVDTENKTVTTIEQANELYQNKGQPTKNSTWRVDVQYSFDELYDNGFIPVTMREFATGNTEQEDTVLTDLTLDAAANTISGTVKANRRITALNLKLTASDNTEFYNYTIYYVQRLGREFTYTYDSSSKVLTETVVNGKTGFTTMEVIHKATAELSDFLNPDYTNNNPLGTALAGLSSGQTYKLSITASTAADRNIPLVTDYSFTK